MSRFPGLNIVWAVAALGFIVLVTVVVAAETPSSLWSAGSGGTVEAAVAALDAGHYDEARRILAPLSSQGNPQAENWLGYMDAKGLGAAPDMQGAVGLLTKAATAGLPEAERRLGEIYLNGRGVLQNVEQARQWLQRAADGGDATAQRMLGEIYAKGTGVPKDPAQAYAWLAIAASQGDPLAASERDALLPSLAPDTLSRAEALAQHTLASIAPSKSAAPAEPAKVATIEPPSAPDFPPPTRAM